MFALYLISALALSGQASPPSPSPESESYRAHLAAAQLAYELGRPADARRWLDGAPATQRGWEWAHLDVLFDQSQSATKDLSASVWAIALHPRGEMAALALDSGGILLWDLKSNARIGELAGHKGQTFCVRFNSDGTRLVSAGGDRVARVWNVAERTQVCEFAEHKFPVAAAMFTADDKHVVSASYFVDAGTPIHGRVHLWEVETGQIIRTYTGGVKPLSSLAISPDGRLLAAGSWDSCTFVWDFEKGGDPRKFSELPTPGGVVRVSAISFSPDATLLTAGTDDDCAHVYRVANGETVATLRDHKSDVNGVAFSPDGATLATAGDDDAIRLWSTRDWSPRATLCGHTAAVRPLAWSEDGRTLYSSGMDRSLRAWDTAWSGYGGVRGRYAKTNYSVNFSPDGRLLACSASDGTVGLVDSQTGANVATWSAHPGGETCTAAISHDGKLLASCSWNKTVRVFDIASHELSAAFDLPAGVAYVAWSPDSSMLAAALRDKTAVLLDVRDKSVIRTLRGHDGSVQSVDFSSDGNRLVTASNDQALRIWDVGSGQELAVMRGHTAKIESAVFTPDGTHVVSGAADGSVRLWNAAGGALVRTLHAGDDSIYRVAVSPDGKRVAACGKQLYILDAATEGALLKYRPLAESIWHLDWSPDGERLAITSWDGAIRVFDSRRRGARGSPQTGAK